MKRVLFALVLMSGAEIAEALRFNATGARGLMQVSGLHYTRDNTKDADHRITSLTLANGQPLDPNAMYRVAMPDFLANGGDGLLPVTSTIPKERIAMDRNRIFRDAFIDVVSKWPQPISPKTDGRVVVVEK